MEYPEKYNNSSSISVKGLMLWAHVGILDIERKSGQWFCVDFRVWLDLGLAAEKDQLVHTADYSIAIGKMQDLSLNIRCFTIEHFSELLLDCIEKSYGRLPTHIILRKCNPPIKGFFGTVEVERFRNY